MVGADVIMRVTGDCPMISPAICSEVLAQVVLLEYTYASNVYPKRTFPKGLDCEAFSMKILLDADKYAKTDYNREHVTGWMQERLANKRCITQPRDESHINYCVDTPEDLERLKGVVSLRLTPVEDSKDSISFLYIMLGERDMSHAISHKELPAWDDHVAFVSSRPYAHWYVIENDYRTLGSIYLTHNREVGLFLRNDCQGQRYGTMALDILRDKHPGPLYANISPNNAGSMRFFERHGFKLIQNTYRHD